MALGWSGYELVIFGLGGFKSIYILFWGLGVYGRGFAIGSGELLVFVGFFGRGGFVLDVHTKI